MVAPFVQDPLVHCRIVLLLVALSLTGTPRPALAQCGPTESDHRSPAEAAGQNVDGDSERRWWNLWSETSPEDRLILGMWTTHLNRENDGWQNDRILALIYRGGYAGSFRTTHGPRAYSLGVERSWVSGSAGPLFAMVGFRAGLVYGYDGRLGWLAEAVPILPFAQPVLYTRLGPLTTDLTYTWVVLSVTAALRF